MQQTSIKSFFTPRETVSSTSYNEPASSSPSARKAGPTKPFKPAEQLEIDETDMGTDATETTNENEQSQTTLQLTYHKGDIFAAPRDSLLIHACNTQGSWGSGIAAAFRTRYPAAYKVYHEYCTKTHHPVKDPIPTGTCLLIPPCETSNGKSRHWIGCLFTSAKYGKAKDKPHDILRNTGPAMMQLLERVKEEETNHGRKLEEVRVCKINSGRFAVPWQRTAKVLEGIVLKEDWKCTIEVWDGE